jgi:hypothetical protein
MGAVSLKALDAGSKLQMDANSRFRFHQVSFQMDDTSFLEHATRHQAGERSTRLPSLLQILQAEWADTSKLIPSTPLCDLSASPLL